jgi:hypothetical protein
MEEGGEKQGGREARAHPGDEGPLIGQERLRIHVLIRAGRDLEAAASQPLGSRHGRPRFAVPRVSTPHAKNIHFWIKFSILCGLSERCVGVVFLRRTTG